MLEFEKLTVEWNPVKSVSGYKIGDLAIIFIIFNRTHFPAKAEIIKLKNYVFAGNNESVIQNYNNSFSANNFILRCNIDTNIIYSTHPSLNLFYMNSFCIFTARIKKV